MTNVLDFKLVNELAAWLSSVRLTDHVGQPLKGIRVTLDPDAKATGPVVASSVLRRVRLRRRFPGGATSPNSRITLPARGQKVSGPNSGGVALLRAALAIRTYSSSRSNPMKSSTPQSRAARAEEPMPRAEHLGARIHLRPVPFRC